MESTDKDQVKQTLPEFPAVQSYQSSILNFMSMPPVGHLAQKTDTLSTNKGALISNELEMKAKEVAATLEIAKPDTDLGI